MNYALFADITAFTHITTIVLVIVGLLACFRYRRFRPWEAGALIAVVVLWSYYGNCPLTILEQYFRDMAGQDTNLTSVGFLPYYANALLDMSLSSKLVQQTTFFTGGAIFAASLDWLSPYFHFHLFSFRKSFKKMFRVKRHA
ncbi:MAG: DUF2784 family protein [bacterium]|nr:DUF2784 family protein [bacterium]